MALWLVHLAHLLHLGFQPNFATDTIFRELPTAIRESAAVQVRTAIPASDSSSRPRAGTVFLVASPRAVTAT